MVTITYNTGNRYHDDDILLYTRKAHTHSNVSPVTKDISNRIEYDLIILFELYLENEKKLRRNFNLAEAITDALANEIKCLSIVDITVVEIVKNNTLMFRVANSKGDVSNRVTVSLVNSTIVTNGVPELVKFLTR